MLLKWSILLFKVQVYLYSSVSLHDQNSLIKLPVHWHMDWCSKLPYLGMKFGHSQNSRSCTHTFSTSVARNWVYFHSMVTSFQNCHIWHETWPLAKTPRTPSFYPRAGFAIELIFALRAAVSEICAHFKIAIFVHESWPLAEMQHILFFAPLGWNWDYILLYRQRFPRYGSQTQEGSSWHLWRWLALAISPWLPSWQDPPLYLHDSLYAREMELLPS